MADTTQRIDEARVDELARAATALTETPTLPAATLVVTATELLVRVDGGETFHGSPAGVPAGEAAGRLYASDLPALYADTAGYVLAVTEAYVTVYFVDAEERLLGYFAGGGPSPVVGNTGGTGTWH